MDESEKTEFRTVKYKQHGLLTKKIDFKTGSEIWIFESPGELQEFEGGSLIDVLDDLSIAGYELVTGSDDEYILRTKEEIEEVQEYFETDDFGTED